MQKVIYAADDEQDILDVIQEFLANAGYAVRTFPTGDALFAAFTKQPCNLVILDVMMPGTDGLTLCKMLRDISNVPIVLLTAKDTEIDHVRGFMHGGDEYITKPFSPTLLVVRINALLRRASMDSQAAGAGGAAAAGSGAAGAAGTPGAPAFNLPKKQEDKTFCDLRLSEKSHACYCGTKDLELTNTEFALLAYLFKNPGEAYSRDELLAEVWGTDAAYIETRVTDETVRRIRRKLKDAGSTAKITSVWGYGYKLEDGNA